MADKLPALSGCCVVCFVTMTTLASKSTYVDLPEPDFLFEKPLFGFQLSPEQEALIQELLGSEPLIFSEVTA